MGGTWVKITGEGRREVKEQGELKPCVVRTPTKPAQRSIACTGVLKQCLLRASSPARLDLPSGGEKKNSLRREAANIPPRN